MSFHFESLIEFDEAYIRNLARDKDTLSLNDEQRTDLAFVIKVLDIVASAKTGNNILNEYREARSEITQQMASDAQEMISAAKIFAAISATSFVAMGIGCYNDIVALQFPGFAVGFTSALLTLSCIPPDPDKRIAYIDSQVAKFLPPSMPTNQPNTTPSKDFIPN